MSRQLILRSIPFLAEPLQTWSTVHRARHPANLQIATICLHHAIQPRDLQCFIRDSTPQLRPQIQSLRPSNCKLHIHLPTFPFMADLPYALVREVSPIRATRLAGLDLRQRLT